MPLTDSKIFYRQPLTQLTDSVARTMHF